MRTRGEQIAELLFSLQNPALSGKERAAGWILFESALRQFLDLKYHKVLI